MATKTFEELKQLAIRIRDEKTNKQNTATRIGTQMLEHLDKLEQDYYDKTATDEELKERDEKLTELENEIPIFSNYIYGGKINNNGSFVKDALAITSPVYPVKAGDMVKSRLYRLSIFDSQKQYVKQIFTEYDWNRDSEYTAEENGFVCAEFVSESYPMYINDKMYVENVSYYNFIQDEDIYLTKSRLNRLRAFMPENYPFVSSNQYAQAILGIYIKKREDDCVYLLKSIRCAQHTESDAAGKYRYEFIIVKAKYNGSTLSDIQKLDGSYEEKDLESQEQKNIQIIDSVDFCAIIDWRLIGVGNGYGEDNIKYQLSDYVFDANNSIYTMNISNIYTDDIIKKIIIPTNCIDTDIDFSPYIVNASIESDNKLNKYYLYRSLYNVPIPSDAKSIYINNTVDTKSSLKLLQLDAEGRVLKETSKTNMVDYHENIVSGAKLFSLTLISGFYSGSEKPNTAAQIVYKNNIFLLNDLNKPFKKEINGIPILGAESIDADKIGAITNIQVGGEIVSKSGTVATLPNASAERTGLMSKEDKQKLDNLIQQGSITINGSGLYKNAANFGFLPTASADDNSTALQNALEGGGTIIVDMPGTYKICNTIKIESNTEIIFGANVFISRQYKTNWVASKFVFVNEGAYTREFNENIKIKGLHLICNNLGKGDDDEADVFGLNGQIAFYCVKHLTIDDVTITEGREDCYNIHVCKFEDIKILNPHIEGKKDAIHLGTGNKFVIRNGIFKTYDDPIALNAHDYATGQPEYGWIENGIIENCYDLADPELGTTGYFARILAGAWSDWKSGNSYHKNGDMCVSNGRIYKTIGKSSDSIVSTIQPTVAEGDQVCEDGLTWRMMQNGDIKTCGVRNVIFRDIYLQKPRSVAFSIHFDNDYFSRSYYPGSESPVQENIILENINMQSTCATLVDAITPVDNIRIINSRINDCKIVNLGYLNTEGLDYGITNVLMNNNVFTATQDHVIAQALNRSATIKITSSIKVNQVNFSLVDITNKGCDVVE